LTGVVGIVTLFLICITYKVTRLVWQGDKIIPLMLICLVLTLLSYIVFFAVLLLDVTMPDAAIHSNYCLAYNVIPIMPIMLFVFAVLLNINKWIYFQSRIRSLAGFNTNLSVLSGDG